MSFFTELFPLLEGYHLVMHIEKKGDTLTVAMIPTLTGDQDGKVVPLSELFLSGTPQELDAGFTTQIIGPISETQEVVCTLDVFRKGLAQRRAEAESKAKAESKKGDAGKNTTPVAPPTAAVPPAKPLSLFPTAQPS